MTLETADALRWLVNVVCGVGKAGGEPEPGEFEAAVEAAKDALAEVEPKATRKRSGK